MPCAYLSWDSRQSDGSPWFSTLLRSATCKGQDNPILARLGAWYVRRRLECAPVPFVTNATVMIKNYPGMSQQDLAARTKLLSEIVRIHVYHDDL